MDVHELSRVHILYIEITNRLQSGKRQTQELIYSDVTLSRFSIETTRDRKIPSEACVRTQELEPGSKQIDLIPHARRPRSPGAEGIDCCFHQTTTPQSCRATPWRSTGIQTWQERRLTSRQPHDQTYQHQHQHQYQTRASEQYYRHDEQPQGCSNHQLRFRGSSSNSSSTTTIERNDKGDARTAGRTTADATPLPTPRRTNEHHHHNERRRTTNKRPNHPEQKRPKNHPEQKTTKDQPTRG